jgi:hypothetical protein
MRRGGGVELWIRGRGGWFPQQAGDRDGEADRDRDADRRGGVQALSERCSSRIEQRRAEVTGQSGRDPDRAAEGVTRGRRRLGRDSGWDPVGHPAAVERDADAAQDRDAKRPAELPAGLRDRRCGPRPLGRRGADDQARGR